MASRLEALDHTIRELRAAMDELGADIAATTQRESRRVLLAQLDEHAQAVEREEGKRAKLVQERHDASAQAAAAHDIRDYVHEVASRAAGFDRERQRATLKYLGAELTLWREGGQPAGWPQRWQVKLYFTGWTGKVPVILPPALFPDVKLSLAT